MSEHWESKPDKHDYPAAFDYLTLVVPELLARQVVSELEAAELIHRKAKDILRASGLPALPPENVHVAKDLAKAKQGKRLSPVLLVRASAIGHDAGGNLIIADGYHRVCASHHLDEDADIPAKLV
ncbi:hypothetical protein [Amycolatopsis sp. CA-230715]|uniref:hypothetical protein n=1 Tax=Amycolatopsis sp. CA-230715 TaxID=2745196 RepID=UPI001C0301C5|nr:hypothetical protein [Amycolatopsis sp. CA-230715]QWF84168.1 hypothetical protein HUW46_07612 [Amycolatopsis sp. CA-230715]